MKDFFIRIKGKIQEQKSIKIQIYSLENIKKDKNMDWVYISSKKVDFSMDFLKNRKEMDMESYIKKMGKYYIKDFGNKTKKMEEERSFIKMVKSFMDILNLAKEMESELWNIQNLWYTLDIGSKV